MSRTARTRTRVKGTNVYALTDSYTGLVNSLSGLGSARDKAATGSWYYTPMTREQARAAYRSNWMARKAVDIPAFDMMRAGWQWQAEDTDIELIEIEERRLDLVGKVLEAQTLARLDGGAAILISDGSEDVSKPINVNGFGKGKLGFLSVVSREYIVSNEIERDPLSIAYGEPVSYSLNSAVGGSLRIHPSRVVRFIGAPIPDSANLVLDQWGDSILNAVNIAIQDATAGQQGIAALIQEAKIDVINVPGLSGMIGTQAYEDALVRRFGLAMQGKSIVNTLILDGDETHAQKTMTFANLDNIQRLFLLTVSGAADIPATRFLGQSPDGMNSTGEADMRNYYDRLKSEQELHLRKPLQKLFDLLVRSAIGNYPSDIHFTFNSLWQMSVKEAAEVGKLEAETDAIYAINSLVPSAVLMDATKNRLIERGQNPGIEAAYDEFGNEPDLDVTEPEVEPGEI